ncbi:MAG: hypothetical protein ACTSV3_07950 [Candidatus Thorarchaeota archaeon]|nr:MAG: hypothetical protein DRP09_08655 [Candidatus Thorarchaeota archaeon]RLI59289.1 MAG: hypothetical protein DRO87_03365 [Candidatus Thorarchaeota archaeon]
MGKGLALLGLILIIVGVLPIIVSIAGITALDSIIVYFYMLNIYNLTLGGYVFSEIMLACIGLGVIFFLMGLIG